MHAFLARIDRFFPVRYVAWALSIVVALWLSFRWVQTGTGAILALGAIVLALIGLRDQLQRTRSVLRNYPLIGHIRYLLEYIRPEIRQYFIESDNEETPFSRQQR
jgi:hypothetical protein